MKNVGIIGISGYSGRTALDILFKHPHVRVTYLSANNTTGALEDIWPQFKKRPPLYCAKYNVADAKKKADIFFLAVPHKVAMSVAPELVKAGKTVIDLSGDYRLGSAADYKKWYHAAHQDKTNLKKAVYGLPELYREDIKKTQLISNPGCYPTAAILALAPCVSVFGKDITSIIIDAKSGVSGAGRKVADQFMFSEVSNNFKAYKPLNHQHKPEIDRYLSKISDKPVDVNFVPHLLPVDRGILETIYVQVSEKLALSAVHGLYKKFYKKEPFVRVLKPGQLPELKYVAYTNFCDVGLTLSANGKLLVITAAIDNLVKGAAGQAVQNMNIVCGFDETEGLF